MGQKKNPGTKYPTTIEQKMLFYCGGKFEFCANLDKQHNRTGESNFFQGFMKGLLAYHPVSKIRFSEMGEVPCVFSQPIDTFSMLEAYW